MPDFSAWTSEDWSAAGSAVTALVAVFAATFAYFQVKEARRTRQEQAQPFVIVNIQPSPVSWQIMNLVVENVGATLARNVKIRFTPEIVTSQKRYDLAGSALLMEGIPTLPPRQRLEVFFDVAPDRKKAALSTRYETEVSFDDARGRKQAPLKYIIDLGYLVGLERVEEYGVHDVAEALRKIERTMKGWTWGSRLQVSTRSEDDRRSDPRSLGNQEPNDEDAQ
jgi:hypothetical protein